VGTSCSAATEKRVILLGSTGSIGTQTLDVIEHLNALADRAPADEPRSRFRVVGLAAGSNGALLAEQAAKFGVRDLALTRSSAALSVPGARVRTGPSAPQQLVREVECDIVLGAMVGAAGLPATLAAVELGRDIALANKETLVAAGELVVPAALKSGSKLLPVDSEHAAVWQCLQGCVGKGSRDQRSTGSRSELDPVFSRSHDPAFPCPPMTCTREIARVILTASGGPFRTASAHDTYHATPAQALKHPTWTMGQKVTIDSASLTNKALEVVEAHWLFGLPSDKIGVLVHPQSIVHALVEYADGNVIAQLGPPDMRSPIQYALTWPERPDGRSHKLDFSKLSRLEFNEPDLERFPALRAAYRIIDSGGTSGAIFNAANEAAVEAFLSSVTVGPVMPFGRIAELSLKALDSIGVSRLRSYEDVIEADAQARAFVRAELGASMRSPEHAR
jgi:1-deoxy-D-xylulose-5-phosphate reductoisomerase